MNLFYETPCNNRGLHYYRSRLVKDIYSMKCLGLTSRSCSMKNSFPCISVICNFGLLKVFFANIFRAHIFVPWGGQYRKLKLAILFFNWCDSLGIAFLANSQLRKYTRRCFRTFSLLNTFYGYKRFVQHLVINQSHTEVPQFPQENPRDIIDLILFQDVLLKISAG